MSKTFIIAEAACTWLHGGLEAAFRSIRAAKECGADAWKTQWTSDPESMAMRRGVARDKYTRLGWAQDALPKLKEECERVGIEFMCTVFTPKDIPLIAPYVSRFKVSAFESKDEEFVQAHYYLSKETIVSTNDPQNYSPPGMKLPGSARGVRVLHCVSKYPTPLDEAMIGWCAYEGIDGLSDHTTSTLTGAVAVGAGARIIEKHVRLSDTPSSDPDYGHSLLLDCGSMDAQGDWGCDGCTQGFHRYVELIREAERML